MALRPDVMIDRGIDKQIQCDTGYDIQYCFVPIKRLSAQ